MHRNQTTATSTTSHLYHEGLITTTSVYIPSFLVFYRQVVGFNDLVGEGWYMLEARRTQESNKPGSVIDMCCQQAINEHNEYVGTSMKHLLKFQTIPWNKMESSIQFPNSRRCTFRQQLSLHSCKRSQPQEKIAASIALRQRTVRPAGLRANYIYIYTHRYTCVCI